MSELRQLGQTDLMLSAIGQGAWQFSQGRGLDGRLWARLADEEVTAIVRAAISGGVNWFDTAEFYGFGASERALSRALGRLGEAGQRVMLATKWQPALRFAGSIRRTIGRRLASLAVARIDLYQVHNALSLSSIEDQMAAMADLVEAGQVRYVGVSNFSGEQMRAADRALRGRGQRLASNQVPYSLLNRRIERNGVLETAQELGVSIIAYSPLEQGLLTGEFHADRRRIRQVPLARRLMGRYRPSRLAQSEPVVQALGRLASLYHVTPVQVALNWLVHYHGDLVLAIPGATSARQARENATAMGPWLKRAELEWLAEVSEPVAF
jgi:aryl-alcohol dehydrogenase-like predicted oxidoreductase